MPSDTGSEDHPIAHYRRSSAFIGGRFLLSTWPIGLLRSGDRFGLPRVRIFRTRPPSPFPLHTQLRFASVESEAMRLGAFGKKHCHHLLPIVGALLAWLIVPPALAHPLIEDALDVVVEPDRVVIDARISPEQILIAEASGTKNPSATDWAALRQKHQRYLQNHLHVTADNASASATMTSGGVADPATPLIPFHLEYSIPHRSRTVEVEQSFLRELGNWTVTCVLRIRQSTEPSFDTALLQPGKAAVLDCEWPLETRPVGTDRRQRILKRPRLERMFASGRLSGHTAYMGSCTS